MSYTYNLILKKTPNGPGWTLRSDKGVILMDIQGNLSQREAFEKASAWASSWNSVTIEVDLGDKQDL